MYAFYTPYALKYYINLFSQKSITKSISMDKVPGKHSVAVSVNRIAIIAVLAVVADPNISISIKMNSGNTCAC